MALLSSPSKVTLSLRGLSIVFLFASVILLITNDNTATDNLGRRFGYKAFYSYKYMLGTGVIGIAYNLFQIMLFAIFRILMKNDSGVYSVIEFYGDKVVSYILATGSAAGFGATIDLRTHVQWDEFHVGSFFVMMYGSVVLLFVGFLCTAILSILSSYAHFQRKGSC